MKEASSAAKSGDISTAISVFIPFAYDIIKANADAQGTEVRALRQTVIVSRTGLPAGICIPIDIENNSLIYI